MDKFKKKDREKILSDWRSCVPAMRSDRSMSLMKRNGPMIVGLYLQEDRANTSYQIIPYVHNLTRPTSSVTLTLYYPLRNRRDTYHESLTLKSHEREFPGASKRLHGQTLFPLEESLSLMEITRAYETYISRGLSMSMPTFLYEDIISLFAWFGRLREAEKRITQYTAIMGDWDDSSFRHVGGKSAFFDRLTNIVQNPAGLHQTYEEQLETLRLARIPDYGLSGSDYNAG